jgi:protein-L-isoaspartate(D-aspartate) O-methyltransferase
VNTLPDTASQREAMIEKLRAMDGIRTDAVAAAFRAVPRHLFAPEETLKAAYAPDTSIWSKRDERGVVVSTVSAAHIQAVMLEQAQLTAGMRVLEIGSGGYNAALISSIVGRDGEVTSLDIDPEIVERARGCLDAAGYHHVRTLVADAEDGSPEHAPYDRVIVTAQAWDLPPAWIDQLTQDGRIVVPLRARGLTRTVALDPVTDDPAITLAGEDIRLCSFVPMQGLGAHDEHQILIEGGRVRLRVEGSAALDTNTDTAVDNEEIAHALRQPRIALWSGVTFDHVDELDLWLGTWIPRFGIITATPSIIEDGLLTAATLRGVPGSFTARSLAYDPAGQLS